MIFKSFLEKHSHSNKLDLIMAFIIVSVIFSIFYFS